jgi:hypothetical protein
MAKGWWRRSRPIALATLIGSGCAQLEHVLSDPARSNVIDGRVWSVDTRASRIELRQDRGATVAMFYDRNTRVFFEQTEYEPSALEQGDVVRALVSRDRNGTVWADRVDVLSSATPNDRIERIDGVFGRSEPRRGYFTVDRGRETLIVFVPEDVRVEDVRRLDRLRSGDRVSLDARVFGRGEMELARFR